MRQSNQVKSPLLSVGIGGGMMQYNQEQHLYQPGRPTPKRRMDSDDQNAPDTADSTSSYSSDSSSTTEADGDLKKKLAKNRAQLKAAKRRISVVSKEKEGLEQELAMNNKKLKCVMAAKDIFLNVNVDKRLYADVMAGGGGAVATTPTEGGKKKQSTPSSNECSRRRRLRSSSSLDSNDDDSDAVVEGERAVALSIIKDQISAAEFVDRMKEHLEESGRQDVLVISSFEPPAEGGSSSSSNSRRLNFHLDFWRTSVPIILKYDVFQAEPMPDFLNGLANEHGPEAVCSMLRDACLVGGGCQKARGCVDAFKEDPLSDAEEEENNVHHASSCRTALIAKQAGVAMSRRVRPLLPELVGEGGL